MFLQMATERCLKAAGYVFRICSMRFNILHFDLSFEVVDLIRSRTAAVVVRGLAALPVSGVPSGMEAIESLLSTL